ncbi:MAG: hypothetical protein AB7S38_09905 [Vulcanimicrobiota bacterium]
MRALQEARAVTFLAALESIGTLRIQRMEPNALFVRFELTADQAEVRRFIEAFPGGLSFQELFDDFGPELVNLLLQADE